MPGIVGLITKKPRAWAEPQLQAMVDALRHESFYETGTWIDESLGVYVGWAIPKGSFADGMPLLNEAKNVCLIFSGEEYPEPGTASRLKEKGHSLEATQSSYLVHWYEDNPSFLSDLNGRFQGILVDQRTGLTTLFNDRFGMNRVYIHEAVEGFYFAAEAKSILAVRPELRQIDMRSLGEYISCGCVLENRTLFKDVQALPPGSAWIFQNGSIKKENYFHPREWEEQPSLDAESYYLNLREAFTRNLPRYFEAAQKVGMSLTGGLDTRMIMAWHKGERGSLPCYTFGGPFRECEDLIIARKVAQHCNQPHEIISIGDDYLKQFSKYAERTVYLSDGCAPVYRASDLYANEHARQIAPIRMTGNYGSEVLRWTPAFKAGEPPAGLFRPELLLHVRTARETYSSVVQGHPISFALFRQAPWHHYGLLALEQTQISLRTPYLDNDFVRTAFRAPTPELAQRDTMNIDLCLRLIADGDSDLRNLRTDRGLGGSGSALSREISRQMLEFTFRAEYAFDYGMPPWLAKINHASPVRFERFFLGRHKFAHYRVWYRDALAKYVREILLDPRTLSRSYLEPGRVETVVNGHLRGDQNHTVELHSLLTIELVHRLFIDPR